MENCKPNNKVEANENLNAQYDCRPNPPCAPIREVAAARGIDSSLLFFFLILVCIVCQCDMDIELNSLLWFFLLLVVIYNNNFFNI